MSSIVVFIALKSCNNLHFPDFFLNNKNRSIPGAIRRLYMAGGCEGHAKAQAAVTGALKRRWLRQAH